MRHNLRFMKSTYITVNSSRFYLAPVALKTFWQLIIFPLQEEPEKVDKLLNIALAQFSQILAKGEDKNLFAAHGAAAVLAEQATRANPPKTDYLIPAKRIFDKVRLHLQMQASARSLSLLKYHEDQMQTQRAATMALVPVVGQRLLDIELMLFWVRPPLRQVLAGQRRRRQH